ncbi:MAG: DUF4321 domain-containing protein [Bacillota bacterium]|uniref:DUF4321 domain-containing protein n=1 Tax=Desulfurispora thermophila TaxID=265470 RepID=UPI0003775BAF|nr:DUF4321 domain-containing protein [Desulfurispora thermophila]
MTNAVSVFGGWLEIMGKASYHPKGVWVLLLLLTMGGLAGSALAGQLGNYWPVLKSSAHFGLNPATLDLHFLRVTFGFTMSLGPLTALGLFLGYWVYSRL